MGKKPRRHNLKGPGSCIFCNGGDLSHEHVFGDWLRHYFSRDENSRHTHGAIEWPTDRPNPAPLVTKRARQGHTGTKTVRVVCRPCNHGWMEGLERNARPILDPMMAGQNFLITPEMQTRLASWATKVAMVAQYLPPRAVVTPQADRNWLKVNAEPPDGWYVFAAAYNGDAWANLSLYQQRITLGESPSAAQDTPPYLAVTTLGLNHVVLFVYSTSWERGREVWAGFDDIALRRVWPPSGRPILWPPLEFFSDDDTTKVANLFNIDPEHAFDPEAYRTIRV